ncbi:hypothetical protein D3C72_1802900 [compost metagenome]
MPAQLLQAQRDAVLAQQPVQQTVVALATGQRDAVQAQPPVAVALQCQLQIVQLQAGQPRFEIEPAFPRRDHFHPRQADGAGARYRPHPDVVQGQHRCPPQPLAVDAANLDRHAAGLAQRLLKIRAQTVQIRQQDKTETQEGNGEQQQCRGQ